MKLHLLLAIAAWSSALPCRRDQPTARPMIRSHRKIALMPAIALLIAVLSPYTLKSAETSGTTTGETVAGFNTQRLERLHDGLRRFVDSGEYAGTISFLMRSGQVADVYVYGMQDIE